MIKFLVKNKSGEMATKVTKNQCLFQNFGENTNNMQWNSIPSEKNIQMSDQNRGGFNQVNAGRQQLLDTIIGRNPRGDNRPVRAANPLPEPPKETKNNLAPTIPKQSPTVKMSSDANQTVSTTIKSPNLHGGHSNITMSAVAPSVKKKLNWFMDTEALIQKDKFKEIMSSLKIYCEGDYGGERLESALLHMTGYFEVIIQRLFADHKKKFMSSEYFKALFAEELGKDKEVEKKYLNDERESAKQTPVSLAGSATKNSFSHKRVPNRNATLYSPAPTPLAERSFSKLGLSDTRHKKVLSDSVLFDMEVHKRHPKIVESMKTRHKREWKEDIINLKLSDTFHVLVVDDLPGQVEVVRSILSCFTNVTSDGAPGGEQAVRMVKQKMDQGMMYHLILTDLTMPYDGFDTTKDIRREEKQRKTRPAYYVIGITGEGLSAGSDQKALESGMNETISKPLKIPSIQNILQKRAQELGLDIEIHVKD